MIVLRLLSFVELNRRLHSCFSSDFNFYFLTQGVLGLLFLKPFGLAVLTGGLSLACLRLWELA